MKPTEGRVVRIKTEEEIIKEYGCLSKVPFGLNSGMESLFGSKTVIRNVTPMLDINKGRYGYRLSIDADDSQWTWHNDMFIYEDNVTEKVYNVILGLST